MSTAPRIALIHAIAESMPPSRAAFAEDWPEAEIVNLFDDSLAIDRARSAEITPEIFERVARLAHHARANGARAILYTCSAFGPAIEAAADAMPIPVLKPNEAMFEASLSMGARVGMLSTFAPSVVTMEREFAAANDARGTGARLTVRLCPEALRALKAGDAARHDALLAGAAADLSDMDVIMMGQFSTARAAADVARATGRPVLTPPNAAVRRLRALLQA